MTMKRTILSMAAASAVVGACAVGDPATETSGDSELAVYSDHQLYAGIVLGRGPVADLVPSIDLYIDRSTAPSAADAARGDAIAAHIARSQPDHLPQFGRDIRSGDPLVIRAAVMRAVKITHDVNLELGGAGPSADSLSAKPYALLDDTTTVRYPFLMQSLASTSQVLSSANGEPGVVLDQLTADLAVLGGA
jgi:hypothetical protein